MRLIVEDDAGAAARRAAEVIARACAAAVAARGSATIALSGGTTPLRMLQAFAVMPLPWPFIFVAQVDERWVADADPRRNLIDLRRVLVEAGPLPQDHLWSMPVELGTPDEAAAAYAAALVEHVGPEATFDLVHLGLGEDGHTASLVPGDPVLQVRDRLVAVSQPYQGTRRMTLTLPVLDAARERLWLVTGAAKARALRDLLDGTGDAPAVRVRHEDDVVVADRAAAAGADPRVASTPGRSP